MGSFHKEVGTKSSHQKWFTLSIFLTLPRAAATDSGDEENRQTLTRSHSSQFNQGTSLYSLSLLQAPAPLDAKSSWWSKFSSSTSLSSNSGRSSITLKVCAYETNEKPLDQTYHKDTNFKPPVILIHWLLQKTSQYEILTSHISFFPHNHLFLLSVEARGV